MKNGDWIDAHAACAVLGVKAQTLYAYVSRHKIRAKSDPRDSRHSLYAKQDIEGLVRRMRRPRARADVAEAAIRWGDPVLATAVSEVRDGTIWLRGQSIEDCAKDMTLEQVAARLCDVPDVICPVGLTGGSGRSSFTRAMKGLVAEADDARPMRGRDNREIAQEAGRMIALVCDACLGGGLDGPIHKRIGSVWGAKPDALDVIRRALVLLSDHELNPSTFAVRVCASTGASLPAALLAGMATLSGPRHGGVAGLTRAALQAAQVGRLEAFLSDHAGQSPYAHGFGHPLYPAGDPRAADLLRQIPKTARARQAVDAVSARVSRPPNIDAALAAASDHFDWPDDAATTLFAVGRTAGWVAHAIEQACSGQMIRPRATYQNGPTKMSRVTVDRQE